MQTNRPSLSFRGSLGVVFRGDVNALSAWADELERLCAERGLTIAFKLASGSKLWIREDEP